MRLLSSGDNYYKCRFVGYAICVYQDSNHIQAGGAAYLNDEDSIVSLQSCSFTPRVTQHELTHNLGGEHEGTANQECTMKGNVGEWCDSCREKILNNFNDWE